MWFRGVRHGEVRMWNNESRYDLFEVEYSKGEEQCGGWRELLRKRRRRAVPARKLQRH